MWSQLEQHTSLQRARVTHTTSQCGLLGKAVGLGLLLLLQYSHGWIQSQPQKLYIGSPSFTCSVPSREGRPVRWNTIRTTVAVSMSSGNLQSKVGIQTIDLSTGQLDSNHDVVGQELAESIVRWLDAEWMPQEVHSRMAMSAKNSYIRCRESGTSDVMDIMMQISTDLDSDWMELYDADAFVNAWDVGNYAADYLTKKSGNEGCACSSELF